jgi:signal transduction histidine kinase
MALNARIGELVGLTLVVLLVVAVATAAHLAAIARVTLDNAADEGRLLSRQLLHQAAHVLRTSGPAGPAAFEQDPSLRALLDGLVGYSRAVVYGAIVDGTGRALLHSDPSLQGRTLPGRTLLDDVRAAGFPQLVRMLLEPPQIYELRLPVRIGDQPFGTIQVGVSTSLVRQTLRAELVRSLALGAGALALAIALGLGAGRVLLGYLRRIARRVERLARRDPGVELGPGDDMGRLAERMKGLGERIQATAGGGAASSGPEGAGERENAVILVGADGAVAFANAAADRLVGRALAGGPLAAALPATHPLVGLAAALVDGRAAPRHQALALPALAGEAREWAVSAYSLRAGGAGEEPAGGLLVLRDLEPARQVESLVSYSQKLAALGRLTSGVTHEVKNPLNAMRIHLELLRARLAQSGTPVSSEIAENLDVIAHEIQRLDRVVQGFLRFVRPQDLRLAPVDVNAVLSDVARLARPEAARSGVEMILDLGSDLPPVTADAELIAQASGNLVSNAVQAMAGGGTLLLTSRHATPAGVEIRVVDQGVGVPPENLEKIFRLYFTTKPGGSGIGLAMVYRIVQMHDGRIDVESTVGKGTTVTLTLPAAPKRR